MNGSLATCNSSLPPSLSSPLRAQTLLAPEFPFFFSRRASATATIASTINCWAYRWLTVFYQAEPSYRRKEPAVSTDLGPQSRFYHHLGKSGC